MFTNLFQLAQLRRSTFLYGSMLKLALSNRLQSILRRGRSCAKFPSRFTSIINFLLPFKFNYHTNSINVIPAYRSRAMSTQSLSTISSFLSNHQTYHCRDCRRLLRRQPKPTIQLATLPALCQYAHHNTCTFATLTTTPLTQYFLTSSHFFVLFMTEGICGFLQPISSIQPRSFRSTFPSVTYFDTLGTHASDTKAKLRFM